jgi:hypothetical protein
MHQRVGGAVSHFPFAWGRPLSNAIHLCRFAPIYGWSDGSWSAQGGFHHAPLQRFPTPNRTGHSSIDLIMTRTALNMCQGSFFSFTITSGSWINTSRGRSRSVGPLVLDKDFVTIVPTRRARVVKEGILGRESLSLDSLTCLALSYSGQYTHRRFYLRNLGKSGVVTLNAYSRLIYGPALELRNKVTPPVPTVCPGPQLRVRLS